VNEPQKEKSLAPQVSDKTSAIAGVPLAIVGVMLLKAHAPGIQISDVEAVAAGSIFATIIGYIGHVINVLVARHITKES
jgi:hypothetical protein